MAIHKVLTPAAASGTSLRPTIIGVDGPSGSGKSTLARRLAESAISTVIEVDDFVSWSDFAGWWPRFDEQVLTPLSQGKDAHHQVRDWAGDEFGSSLKGWKTARATPVVIIEGVTCTRRAVGPAPYVALDDKAPASGPNHLTYTGGWKPGTNAGDYLSSDSYTSTKGAKASFTFTGTGFRLWFSAAGHHGIASVTADRRTATGTVRTSFTVDQYSPVGRDGVSAAASPPLPIGTYTVTVTASGSRNAASTGTTVSLDRIDLGRS